MSSAVDLDRARSFVDTAWRDDILPALKDFIRIPAKSPHFDADWAEHGFLEEAVQLAEQWCRAQNLHGASVEVIRQPGRTPVLLVDVAGTGAGTVLLYGHLDKQPEASGWDSGKGPWTPVVESDRLYGRGAADDGYALFASLTAIRTLQAQGLPHPSCVLLIETCEESGSYDLPAYLDALGERIGNPDLVVCLDSGCGNYDQLWLTTSLRGIAAGDLSVEILDEAVHSGDASGVVPSSFRILRQLLDRLEDPVTGAIRTPELHADIPEDRRRQAAHAAEALAGQLTGKYPLVAGARPMSDNATELVLNRSWRPALSVTGADGLPRLADAGNVLRPHTSVRLSMRLPPTVDGAAATRAMQRVIEADPPYGARVRFQPAQAANGWNAPAAPWLEDAVDAASHAWFGAPAVLMGEGGTIPLMSLLGERFPDARFLVTGVLGPQANAHGPNEFLHLGMAQRLTGAVAGVLHTLAQRRG